MINNCIYILPVTLKLSGSHSESYVITLPSCYARSIVTKPWIELGDKCTISCAETGYSANIDFQVQVNILQSKSTIKIVYRTNERVNECKHHRLVVLWRQHEPGASGGVRSARRDRMPSQGTLGRLARLRAADRFRGKLSLNIWQDLIIKGPKKHFLHFRWRRVLLLVLLLLFRLQAKRIIFCKSDKKPDFFAMLKRFYPTYIFYRSSSPISNNVKFQKSVLLGPFIMRSCHMSSWLNILKIC